MLDKVKTNFKLMNKKIFSKVSHQVQDTNKGREGGPGHGQRRD